MYDLSLLRFLFGRWGQSGGCRFFHQTCSASPIHHNPSLSVEVSFGDFAGESLSFSSDLHLCASHIHQRLVPDRLTVKGTPVWVLCVWVGGLRWGASVFVSLYFCTWAMSGWLLGASLGTSLVVAKALPTHLVHLIVNCEVSVRVLVCAFCKCGYQAEVRLLRRRAVWDFSELGLQHVHRKQHCGIIL